MKNNKSDKPFRKGVIIIVVDKNDNFLLVQKNGYKDNEWNFLGGGCEEGETLEQNLYRELKEEIDSDKSDLEIIGVSSYKIEYDYPPDTVLKVHGGKFRGQSYDQVILRLTGNKNSLIFTPEEFRKHKWVKYNELEKYLVFPNQYENHKKTIDELLPDLVK
jgi:putative (di)nucleoside polyphosphate hydrolase